MHQTIKVNPEYRSLIPRPTLEEYQALEADMLQKGEATIPLTINKTGTLLDGHTRWDIIKKHPHIKYRTESRHFDSTIDERLFIVSVNLNRRHLTPMQKIMLAKPLETLIAEKARQNQIHAGKHYGRGSIAPNGTKQSKLNPVDTSKTVAIMIGVSERSYQRGKKIRDEAPPALIREALSGERMITRTYNKLKKIQNLEEAHRLGSPEMPKGVYDVLYADPPWRYNSEASQRGKAEHHYATMSTSEICELEVPSADDALLFMWSTNAHLGDAFSVLEAWGFRYVSNFVWVKDKFGLGWYMRGQHELLLLARKGSMPHPRDSTRFPEVIVAPRGVHSAKPLAVFEMIEKMYPGRRYIELFSRARREGWVTWGLEAK